jgi:Cu-Zn family superoxide dismutase
MKIFSLLILITSVFVGILLGSFYYYLFPFHKTYSAACATIYPTKGNQITGTIQFKEAKNGIHIVATMQGLTQGKHGFHIHEYGDCSSHDAVCAGNHFNPTNAPHGAPTDCNVHIGDLGNITADEHGNAQYDEINSNIKLFGPHSIIGRSVIVHEQPDDLHSQPTGNSGNRIGCGVIGISK